MLMLGHALNRTPILHQLCDHQNPQLLTKPNGHWQRWLDDVQTWVKQLDQDSDVIAYSLSASLILQALSEANIQIRKLVLLSPSLFFRRQETMFTKLLPDTFMIPSFNHPKKNCRAYLPLGLYRELWREQKNITKAVAQETLVMIHRYDELLDVGKTQSWAKQLNFHYHQLNTPLLPPFHATYDPRRLPLPVLANFINSNT